MRRFIRRLLMKAADPPPCAVPTIGGGVPTELWARGKWGQQLKEAENLKGFPKEKMKPPETKLGPIKINEKTNTEKMFNDFYNEGRRLGRLDHHGFTEASTALGEQGTSKVILRDFSKPGYPIQGVISFDASQLKETGEMLITHLGSVGDVKGTGTELVRHAVERAKGKGVSLTFESTKNAEKFYERLGFVHIDSEQSKIMGAGPERLKAIARKLGSSGRGL